MEYKDISVRVYVVGDPEVKTIKTTSGVHAGEDTAVLNFRAVERKYKKEADGTRKPLTVFSTQFVFSATWPKRLEP